MNKEEIYQLLDRCNLWHEITEHEAVYNMEDLIRLLEETGVTVNVMEEI